MERDALAASAAGTAAQLRMQLAHITAASQMLERTMEKGGRSREYLAVLNQSICRMLRIIGRMELMDRLTSEDEIRIFPTLVDLGPWTGRLARRAQGVLQGAGVALEYQGPERLMANVDQRLVEQMTLELLAAAAGGAGPVSFSLSQCQEGVRFTVRGDGVGQAVRNWERADDRQEDWGLSLARQIAQLHGGSLVWQVGGQEQDALSITLPLGKSRPTGALEEPKLGYDPGGFDPVLVAFSQLLPQQSFLPEGLG